MHKFSPLNLHVANCEQVIKRGNNFYLVAVAIPQFVSDILVLLSRTVTVQRNGVTYSVKELPSDAVTP